MKRNSYVINFALLLLVQAFCLWASPLYAKQTAKQTAFVSILPQKFLLHSIAGDLLNIGVLVKPGRSPETFSPDPKQMADLSKASLFFTIGMEFEQIMLKRIVANNQQLKIIPTQQGISKSELHEDPHIWLDPILVKRQAEIIYLALVKHFPESKADLTSRYQQLTIKIDKLHTELKGLFSALDNNNRFVIFHPALSRFAKRYNLVQIAIEKHGKANSARYMAELISSLQNQSVKYVLVEKQFSKKEAQTVAQVLKAELLEIDPLSKSWLDNFRDMAAQIKKALF